MKEPLSKFKTFTKVLFKRVKRRDYFPYFLLRKYVNSNPKTNKIISGNPTVMIWEYV